MGLLDKFNDLHGEHTVIRSPINYPGNKSEIMEFTLEHLPKSKKFVDVFGGSGQVMLSKPACDLDVYNDLNNGLTSFFKMFQNPVMLKEFTERIQILVHSKQMFEEFFEEWPTEEDPVTKAIKFYYVIQMSHLSRGNSFGRITRGKADLYRKLDRYVPHFGQIHNRFQAVQIENMDFSKLIYEYDDYETVFYLDPPYWGSNQYHDKMSKKQHAEMCDQIFRSKGFFALAASGRNEVYEQYEWSRVEMTTIKMKSGAITGTPDNRKIQDRSSFRTEYLFIKEVSV